LTLMEIWQKRTYSELQWLSYRCSVGKRLNEYKKDWLVL